MQQKTKELSEYWLSPAISQSVLKRIGNAGTSNDDSNDTKTMFTGSFVDSMLTNEEGFNDFYYISKLKKKPSDTVCEIMDTVFAYTQISTLEEVDKDWLVKVAREKNHRNNYKDETLLESLIKEGSDYFNELTHKGDRIFVSLDEYANAKIKVDTFKSHPATARYFAVDFVYETLFQVPLYQVVEGVKCKGLLDMVVFDYVNKTFKVGDIKTTDLSMREFTMNCRKFRYDFQMAYYVHLAKLAYPDYKFVGSFWVVMPKNNRPFVLQISEHDLHIGEWGADKLGNKVVYSFGITGVTNESDYPPSDISLTQQTRIKGWRECLENYKQGSLLQKEGLLQQGDFDLEYFNSGGRFPIKGTKPKSIWE